MMAFSNPSSEPAAPTKTVDAALASNEHVFLQRNGTIAKLGQRGVKVTRQLDVGRVTPESLRKVQCLIAVASTLRRPELDALAQVAKAADIPFFALPHQTSGAQWEVLSEYVQKHGVPAIGVAPASGTMRVAAPVSEEEHELVRLYEEENETLRDENQKLISERDRLANERDRLTTERDKARGELDALRLVAQDIPASTAELDEARARIAYLEKHVRDIVANRDNVIDRLRAQIQAAQSAPPPMREEAPANDTELSALTTRLKSQQNQLLGIDGTLETLVGMVQQLAKQQARVAGVLAVGALPAVNPPPQPEIEVALVDDVWPPPPPWPNPAPAPAARARAPEPARSAPPPPPPAPEPEPETEPAPWPAPRPRGGRAVREAAPPPAPPPAPEPVIADTHDLLKSQVLQYIAEHPGSTPAGIFAGLEIDTTNGGRALAELFRAGRVERSGVNRPYRYSLAGAKPAAPKPVKVPVAAPTVPSVDKADAWRYRRLPAGTPDAETMAGRIYRYVEEHPGSTVLQTATALGLQLNSATTCFNSLRVSEFLYTVGDRKPFGWKVLARAKKRRAT